MNELIQWTKGAKYWDKCYNPVIGCKKISEGCQNCYAERVVGKFGINDGNFEPKVMKNAKVPTRGIVFVGNMTDGFGEWVMDEYVWKYLSALSPDAINLVLTKRSSRMQFFTGIYGDTIKNENIWMGVTCENQARADERIPDLIKANVSRRWLSVEPLLGPVNLAYSCFVDGCNFGTELHVDWVVVGAESGPDRRECKVEWVESIVEQCQYAKVPVFVKQIHLNGKLVTDISKFPEHLRIRQVPWNN